MVYLYLKHYVDDNIYCPMKLLPFWIWATFLATSLTICWTGQKKELGNTFCYTMLNAQDFEISAIKRLTVNPLKAKIKIWILICCPYSFATEVWGEVDKISSKFILCDQVRNSHDHSVLKCIGITWRNLMLITLRAYNKEPKSVSTFDLFTFFHKDLTQS